MHMLLVYHWIVLIVCLRMSLFFNYTATTEIYTDCHTLSLHDDLPISVRRACAVPDATVQSWRLLNLLADDVRLRGGQVLLRHSVLRSEEHTSELQSLMRITYAVFCLTKKNSYISTGTAKNYPTQNR